MKKILLTLFFTAVLVIPSAPDALADAWWGRGYKSSAWVLANGGTIINYKIIASGAADRYKAIMYRDGKVIEWENRKSGHFDDAKDGTYVVKAFRGGIKEQKTSKGGKKILSSDPIVAHGGETIHVTLDDVANKVTVISDRRVAQVAKPVAKKVMLPAPVEKEIIDAEPAPALEQDQSADVAPIVADDPRGNCSEPLPTQTTAGNFFNLNLGNIK